MFARFARRNHSLTLVCLSIRSAVWLRSTRLNLANPTVEESNATSQLSPGTDVIETSSIEALPPAIFTEDRVAIRGADPVVYFIENRYTENRYVPDSADFTYEWADATW